LLGPYTDSNDYLDIQFRLLREDLVAPLRAGISQYNLPQQDRDRRQKVIFVYEKVSAVTTTVKLLSKIVK
jgi:hypothetical protein